MVEAKTEREAVAQVYAQQDEVVQEVIREVLRIERARLHMRQQDRATVDLLTNAIRGVVS
jgi:hypothetical protein